MLKMLERESEVLGITPLHSVCVSNSDKRSGWGHTFLVTLHPFLNPWIEVSEIFCGRTSRCVCSNYFN